VHDCASFYAALYFMFKTFKVVKVLPRVSVIVPFSSALFFIQFADASVS